MKRAITSALLILIILCVRHPALRPTLAQSPAVRLLSSDDESLIIAVTLPDVTLRDVVIQGEKFTKIEVAGWDATRSPGEPQLPQIGALLGLPPDSAPTWRVLDLVQERAPAPNRVYPAPSPIATRKIAPPVTPRYAFTLDEQTYTQDAFYPSALAAWGQTGWLRDQRVAQITFHPIRYNPVRGELEITRRLVLQVDFHATGRPTANAAAGDIVFAPLLESALLNGNVARRWRAAEQPHVAATTLNVAATQPNSSKITIKNNGLYKLSYLDLQNANIPVASLDPRTLRLYEQGTQVAIRVIGQEDGNFDENDYILFYGRTPPSRYVDHNIYWLCYGGELGLRMETRDVAPGAAPDGPTWGRARYAENHFYDSTRPAADGDHWYAANVRPGEPQTATLALMPPATGAPTGAPTATLHVRLVGYTSDHNIDPDHHAVVAVNGQRIGDMRWDGVAPVTVTLTVDAALLNAGENRVTVSAPGDSGASVEGMWLDTVELDYAFQRAGQDQTFFWGEPGTHTHTIAGFGSPTVALYDITAPRRPIRLANASTSEHDGYTLDFSDAGYAGRAALYLALTGDQVRRPAEIAFDAPSDLHNTANGADYLIITHADFIDAVQPLAAYRREQQLRVAVIDVQDIYDEFNGGLLHPDAIREFIAYAYAQWSPPAPAYVLLVGDGSYDFLDHYGYGPSARNTLPPYLAMVDPWWGETAADHRYAMVHGKDLFADVLLGRLPVTSAEQAATVVQKILAYEQTPWYGDWNARHVFVADDRDGGNDFAASTDAVYNTYISPPWIGRKIYLDELTPEKARQDTLDALNRGALLIGFAGHSSWHQWAAESLLDIDDVPRLANDHRWPVILSMTCFTGFFQHPEYGTLDESLLRLKGGGAVATWSPSGLGIDTGHRHLYSGFYRAVFDQQQTQLGLATASAKLYLYSQAPAYADLLDTFHLFGDPAMPLNLTIRPWPHSIYLPIVTKK